MIEVVKMINLINEISIKISDLINSGPAADLNKNLHALLMSAFTKLELVSKDEFDAQADLLRVSREKLGFVQDRLNSLETKIAELEDLLQKNNK